MTRKSVYCWMLLVKFPKDFFFFLNVLIFLLFFPGCARKKTEQRIWNINGFLKYRKKMLTEDAISFH